MAAFLRRKRAQEKTAELQEEFGAEYKRTLEQKETRSEAEDELVHRMERVETFDLRRLSPDENKQYAENWEHIQKDFVEEPGEAVEKADQLVRQVMTARGYPMADFEQRAADISVHYPKVVGHYRSAHSIIDKQRDSGASTEQLRQAMVHYKVLFEELLETREENAYKETEGRKERQTEQMRSD